MFLPQDGALGFRAPAGSIFSLNDAGDRRGATSHWENLRHALREDAPPAEVKAFVSAASRTAAILKLAH